MVFFKNDFFIKLAPLNLALMFVLLCYTQKKISIGFCLFTVLCIAIGLTAALIGTKTGIIFGEKYGIELGPEIENVPISIGINWFIIIYCVGISIQTILNGIIEQISVARAEPPPALKALSVIVDGATLALLFDWIIEPAAARLGYWHWGGNGEAPFYNYLCWFLLSMLSLSVFHNYSFEKSNKFAINLLMIQAMYFLLIRTFL